VTVEAILRPHEKDLGGFTVRRSLPAAQRQSVGPFVFFDHFGPVTFTPPHEHDVRPHPHIGLATVTYLFKGAMMHRDSLGSVQRIEPGAINWMTAGSGVVHSERSPDDFADKSYELHGLQLWAALPTEFEETPAGFSHTPAADIPSITLPGATVRVLIGECVLDSAQARSPVRTFAPTLYLDIELAAGASFILPPLQPERAVYAVQGDVAIDDAALPPRQLAVLAAGETVSLTAQNAARIIVIGGAPLDAHRFIWWNFVSSSKARIHAAADAWQAQRMGHVPGESGFIPLPEKRLG
jgi:redox-sensitive bicupin YhaK (pirin superfamily)